MPTLQELFRDRAALDLALHEIISVTPVELRLAMVAEPRGPREIAALQRARDRYPEIGGLPAIVFRAALAAGIIARELHTPLEEEGEHGELHFTDDGTTVVNGPRRQVTRPAATISHLLANALVISEVNADTLWRAFVHLMRDHYHRPTFFGLRVERGGTIRLLRPASAPASPPSAL